VPIEWDALSLCIDPIHCIFVVMYLSLPKYNKKKIDYISMSSLYKICNWNTCTEFFMAIFSFRHLSVKSYISLTCLYSQSFSCYILEVKDTLQQIYNESGQYTMIEHLILWALRFSVERQFVESQFVESQLVEKLHSWKIWVDPSRGAGGLAAWLGNREHSSRWGLGQVRVALLEKFGVITYVQSCF